MGDVNNPTAPNGDGGAPVQPQGPVTTPDAGGTPASGSDLQPGTTPGAAPQDRTVPLSVMVTERKKLRDQIRSLQRDLATAKGSQATQSFDPDDLETVQSHPYVQGLSFELSTSQLKEGAAEILAEFPSLPEPVRKAIVRNPRGFVGPNAQGVQEGLVDIRSYIEDYMAEIEEGATPAQALKQVPVAGTNQPAATQLGARPAEVQAILDKPVDEWTDKDMQILEEQKGKRR